MSEAYPDVTVEPLPVDILFAFVQRPPFFDASSRAGATTSCPTSDRRAPARSARAFGLGAARRHPTSGARARAGRERPLEGATPLVKRGTTLRRTRPSGASFTEARA
jgi:hypothetical protein